MPMLQGALRLASLGVVSSLHPENLREAARVANHAEGIEAGATSGTVTRRPRAGSRGRARARALPRVADLAAVEPRRRSSKEVASVATRPRSTAAVEDWRG